MPGDVPIARPVHVGESPRSKRSFDLVAVRNDGADLQYGPTMWAPRALGTPRIQRKSLQEHALSCFRPLALAAMDQAFERAQAADQAPFEFRCWQVEGESGLCGIQSATVADLERRHLVRGKRTAQTNHQRRQL